MLITTLKLSKRLQEKLHEARFVTVQDLLFHLPVRYEHIEERPYDAWMIGDKIWLEGVIIEPFKQQYLPNRRSLTRFQFESELGLFQVSIFNRPWLKVGMHISMQARYDGKHQLTALNYNTQPLNTQLGFVPIYALRKQLTQKDMIKAISLAIDVMNERIVTDIPKVYRERYRLISVQNALHWIHKAPSSEAIHQAERSLKYEEFLRFQTKIQMTKATYQEKDFGIHKLFDRRLITSHINQLPFKLTPDQNQVLTEILDDLQRKQRMNRLLQGDVGSGKTVIAALAMYGTVLAHYQAAMMVPTEILARQHVQTLKQYLPETVKIELLVSALSSADRKRVLEALSVGEIDILVGTHALISDDVVFKNCGLVVADEQHRFGVEQRRKLSMKGDKVDFLLMSATPIPRTLASVLYNDMDVSSITQYHEGKAKVKTQLIRENSLRSVFPTLIQRIEASDQVYVICPSIEDDPNSDRKTVESITQALRKVMPKHVRIERLHGKLAQNEKESILKAFYAHEIDCLISTTVIEVGVHVAQANTMIIYDSDRFGLSQLHQLRGRIGRGQSEGLCFLLTETDDEKTLERLEVLVKTQDGFVIANKDLELRGPGELFGLKQSGLPSFRIANVVLDHIILKTAQQDASELLKARDQQNQKWIQNCQEELLSQSFD
jgi:ATP-dependent DNA helicase RecG